MTASTITSSTFTLVKQGPSTPLPAIVSYSGQTATLDPNANLSLDDLHGDRQGRRLRASRTWRALRSSPTSAGLHHERDGPTTFTYLSNLTWTSPTTATAPSSSTSRTAPRCQRRHTITLNGTTYAKGLGVHAVSEIRYALSGCAALQGRGRASTTRSAPPAGSCSRCTRARPRSSTAAYDGPLGDPADRRLHRRGERAAAGGRRAGADGIDSDHADWALARIECGGGGGDTTPPTITGRTPAPGATGVALDASPTATFSEAMNRLDHHDDHLHARPAGHARRRCRHSSPSRSDRDPRPERQPAALDDLHGHRQGRRLGRQGPGRQCARRRRQLELHDERRRAHHHLHLPEQSHLDLANNGNGPVELDKSNGTSLPTTAPRSP